MTKTAVILGVGPAEGLGTYLAVKAAEEGLHVIVSGRTQTSLDAVVEIISSSGGQATGIVADATDLSSVNTLIKKAEAYMYLYRQPRNAWTLELDLRTHKENF